MKKLQELNSGLSFAKKIALIGGGSVNNTDPSDLSTPPKSWYDSSLVDYKTQGAQEYLTFNGSAVSQWDDRSGNTNHVDQTVEADQPASTSTVPNGLRVVEFASTQLLVPQGAWTLTQPFQYFMAVQWDDAPNIQRYNIIDNAGTRGLIGVQQTNRKYILYSGATLANAGAIGFNWSLLECLFNGASSEIVEDGVSVASGNAGSQNVSGGLNIGGNGTNYFTGRIGELICLDYEADGDDTSLLNTYLSEKWGITI